MQFSEISWHNKSWFDWDELHDLDTVPCNEYFFALLDQLRQLGEVSLRLMHVDCHNHETNLSPVSPLSLDIFALDNLHLGLFSAEKTDWDIKTRALGKHHRHDRYGHVVGRLSLHPSHHPDLDLGDLSLQPFDLRHQ